MSAPEVGAVVFDVNETLFSLDRLRHAFTDTGLDSRLVPVWFAGLLRDGFALTALGGFRPFAEVAAETLCGLDDRIDDRTAATVVAAMRELRPHPDVEAGLGRLHATTIPTATPTNGSAETVQTLLDRAGLGGYIGRNPSVDAVRRWKPAPEPYWYAAAELGVDPRRWCWCRPPVGLRRRPHRRTALGLGVALPPALADRVPRPPLPRPGPTQRHRRTASTGRPLTGPDGPGFRLRECEGPSPGRGRR